MDYAIGSNGDDRRVAVVMPVYNDAAFVGQSISSVLSQTYTDYHFYIVDNGSTDTTRYVLEKFANDPRITLVRRNRNAHSQAAPDLIRSLKNEVLALIFSDDEWEEHKLLRSIEALGNASAVISNCSFIDEQSRPLYHVPPTQFYGDLTSFSVGELLYRTLFYGNPIHPVAVVARLDAYRRLGGYLSFMNRIGDMQFFSSLLINEPCEFIPDRLQRIRILAKQSSTYTSKDLPGAQRKTQALFYEQYYNLQNFVTPAGLEKLHLIIGEIDHADSQAMKLWIFGQALIASQVSSYTLFGVNCLLKAATVDPQQIQLLIEKSFATDISNYFEELYSRVGQRIFTLPVTTYDDAATVAHLSGKVAELEEYIQSIPPWIRWLRKVGLAKRRRRKVAR